MSRPLAITRVNHQIRNEFLTLLVAPSLDGSFERTGLPGLSIASLNSYNVTFLIDLSARRSNALISASYQHGGAAAPNLRVVFTFRTVMTPEAYRATAVYIETLLRRIFATGASISLATFVTTIDLLSTLLDRPTVRASSCTLPVLIRELRFSVQGSVGRSAPNIEGR